MFSSTYREARQRFLDTAAAQELAVDTRVLEGVDGLEGETLATDVVRIGPADAKRLLVLTSATHGVEGFCGSGAQIALMRDDVLPALMDKLGVAMLLVHAINPYGFSYLSRTTEGNVDLNRNSVDFAGPLPQNPGYAELHDLLIPATWPPDEANVAAIRAYIDMRGQWTYQQAVTTGQYTHAQGMFYGGAHTAWSTRTMRNLLAEYGEPCTAIGWIDIHTGLGPSGFGAKICVGDVQRARRWWGADVTSPSDGTSMSPGRCSIRCGRRVRMPRLHRSRSSTAPCRSRTCSTCCARMSGCAIIQTRRMRRRPTSAAGFALRSISTTISGAA